jgi:hypothetical protein
LFALARGTKKATLAGEIASTDEFASAWPGHSIVVSAFARVSDSAQNQAHFALAMRGAHESRTVRRRMRGGHAARERAQTSK